MSCRFLVRVLEMNPFGEDQRCVKQCSAHSAQFQSKRENQGSFRASKLYLTMWFWELVTCINRSNSVNLNEQNLMSFCLALYCWADVLFQYQIHMFSSTFSAKSSNILNHADSSQLRVYAGFPHDISVLTYA